MINRLFNKINPEVFLVPGILGAYVGGIVGGLTSLTENIVSKERKIVMGTLDCMGSIGTGAVAGGILGTIWPVSLASYAWISSFKEKDK